YSSQFPVRFRVDPGELIQVRMDFKLVPNAGEIGRFWGIWDVLYTSRAHSKRDVAGDSGA
ncbi:LIC10729 family protein, partial [Leptospira interrogans]